MNSRGPSAQAGGPFSRLALEDFAFRSGRQLSHAERHTAASTFAKLESNKSNLVPIRISVTRTNRQRRTWNRRIVIARAIRVPLFVMAIAACLNFNASAFSQDAGLESLKRQSLPWYDADTEQIKPVELEPREEPRSLLRGTVPERKPTAKNNRVKNWFEDWDLSWGSSFGTFLYWMLWLGLGVVVAILIVWGVRNIDVRQPLAREETETTRSRAQSVAQLPFHLDAGDEDFRSLAAKAFQANDYRQAIVWLFSHVLISLDQQDLIRLKKGKTNRQYLRELAKHRELSTYYADVMLPFEATFFGDKDLDRDQFERCWNGLDHFEQRVTTTGGVA